ncbi:MAG: transposase [Lentisphaeria bacterium]|nr:transposase [Lentisphaeria bacterium]
MPVNLYYTQRIRGFQQESVKYNGSSVRYSLMTDKISVLPENAKTILRNMRGEFQDLGDAYMFKETSRRIYAPTKTSCHTEVAFHPWCKPAEETNIPELKTMARTIRNKLDGIVSFWTFRHISNAKMEGFNNKIRWLIKQAYGFRDREYFKLKIYQLPEISSVKEL